MKKAVLVALFAALCLGFTSCENEIGCLYEVCCADPDNDATWKTFGNGYSGVRDAFVEAGFNEETTDMFSKRGKPTSVHKLVKQTLESAVSSNESGLLKGFVIRASFFNDESHPVVAEATYPGRPGNPE